MSVRSARRRDLRLLPVALAGWAGAGAAISFPQQSPVLAALLWATAAALLAVAMRCARTTVLALVAVSLAVAAAAASHVALAQPAREAVAGLQIDGGRSVAFEVDVVGKVERSATGLRFDAITRSATIGAEARAVSAPVLVRAPERPPGLDLGARARVTGTAFRADTSDRAVLVVEASALVVESAPAGPLAVAATLREGLVAAVADLPEPGAGLVPGLAVGDTSAVTDELDQQMKASSLSHLTAVSGANCEKGSAKTTYRAHAIHNSRSCGVLPMRAPRCLRSLLPRRFTDRYVPDSSPVTLSSSVPRRTETNGHTAARIRQRKNQSNESTRSRPYADAMTQRSQVR